MSHRSIIAGALTLSLVLLLGNYAPPLRAQEAEGKTIAPKTKPAPAEIPGIKQRLSAKKGNRSLGRSTIISTSKGNCLACHEIPSIKDHPYQGNVGPSLESVAKRYTTAQLRQLIVDPRILFPTTIMPPYYVKDGLYQVAQQYEGKTILTAQEVEDVLSYLETLR